MGTYFSNKKKGERPRMENGRLSVMAARRLTNTSAFVVDFSFRVSCKEEVLTMLTILDSRLKIPKITC